MLNNDTAYSAIFYSDKLADEGINIEPVPGTGLHNAMTTVSMPYLDFIGEHSTLSNHGMLSEVQSDAEIATDGLSSLWASNISQALHLMSKEISPTTAVFADEVAERMKKLKETYSSTEYELIVGEVPDWYYNDSGLFDADNYKGRATAFNSDDAIELDTNNLTVLVNNLAAGDSQLDTNIRNWLAANDLSTFVGTAQALSRNGSSQSIKYVMSKQPIITRVNDCVLLIMLCDVLAARPPETAESGLDDTLYYLRNVKNLAGTILAKDVAMLDSYLSSGAMILDRNAVKKTITVFGPTYKQYIAKGGTATAVLGILISNARVSTIDAVVEKTVMLNAAWNAYHKQVSGMGKTERLANFKVICCQEFEATGMTSSEKELYASDTYPKHVIDTALAIIDTASEKDMDDVELFAIDLITAARFPKANARNFMQGVLKAVRAGVDMDDVIYNTCLEYIADHVTASTTIA